MVANWREKIAMSRALIPRKRSKICSSLNCSPCSVTSRTISPRSRSCSVTWPLVSASTSPRGGTPATSTALKAKVLMSLSSSVRGGHRGSRVDLLALDRAEQPLQLLGHRGALFGQLPGDPAHSDQLGEVRVHRLHPDGARGLDGGVD